MVCQRSEEQPEQLVIDVADWSSAVDLKVGTTKKESVGGQ
jgi:hypothetical protein